MRTFLKKQFRPFLASVSALLAIIMLGGCSIPDGRQSGGEGQSTHREAEGALMSLPFITSAEVVTSYAGTPNQVTLIIRLSADESFAADPAVLLDYALALGWSTSERKPTTTVQVDLRVEGQSLDLEAIGSQVGVTGYVDAANKYDPSLQIGVDEMEAVYGPWPGQVPEKPSALVQP